MKIFLDNTGLHAAGRCLRGEAVGEVDVEGLVQLGCFLAMGRSLHVNGFEHTPVRKFTEETKEQIESVTADGPQIILEPSSTYRAACVAAGDRAARELRDGFDIDHPTLHDLKPSGIHPANVASQIVFLREVMTDSFTGNLVEVSQNALEQKAVGAVNLMLSSSEDLRNVFRNMHRERMWEDEELFAITAVCRYHLNQMLAEQVGAVSGPAVARARIVANRNRTVIDALDDSLRAVAEDAVGAPIPTPPLFGTLVKRSGGIPSRLLEEAAALNRRLSKAVTDFQKEWSSAGDDTIAAMARRRNLAHEVRAAVGRDLKILSGTSVPIGAELIWLLSWIPIPRLKVDLSATSKWFKERLANRKYSVFSEVVAGTPADVKKSAEWADLVNASTRQAG